MSRAKLFALTLDRKSVTVSLPRALHTPFPARQVVMKQCFTQEGPPA